MDDAQDAELENAHSSRQRLKHILKITNQKLRAYSILSAIFASTNQDPKCNLSNQIELLMNEYTEISNDTINIRNEDLELVERSKLRMKKLLLHCSKNMEHLNSNRLTKCGHLKELCEIFEEFEHLAENRLGKVLTGVIQRQKLPSESELDEILKEQNTLLNQLKNNLREVETECNLKTENNLNIIKFYENEISKVKDKIKEKVEKSRLECTTELSTTKQRFEREKLDLKLEIAQINQNLQMIMAIHERREKRLKSEKISLQNELLELKQSSSDAEILKQETIKNLQSSLGELLQQGEILYTQRNRLKRQNDAILYERERKRIEEERLAEEFFTKSSAAIIIQTRWRGYQARLKLRAKLRKWKKSKRHKLTKMDSVAKVVKALVRQKTLRQASEDPVKPEDINEVPVAIGSFHGQSSQDSTSDAKAGGNIYDKSITP